jgi:hypothetical protein
MPGPEDLPKFGSSVGLLASSTFEFHTLLGESSFFRGEVPGSRGLGCVREHDETEESDWEGNYTVDDEEPCG